MKRGFYIGRFQPYHNGHQSVLEHIAKNVDEIIIGVGSAQLSHTCGQPVHFRRTCTDDHPALYLTPLPVLCDPDRGYPAECTLGSTVRSMAPPFDICYSSNPLVVQLSSGNRY